MGFLDLIGVHKRFGGVVAVHDFNLSAERGEFVSFLGPSGCGKTTTLRMIAGFETPTTGRIVLDGVDITSWPPNRRNVGMVFQSYALFPNMSVADNIGFGLKVHGRTGQEIRRRVNELLELTHLTGLGHRYPWELSGGQQQRVALARALAIEPQVLLLDEPLSALDAKIRVALRHQLRSIQRKLGITTIYVTHDQEEALSLSDRVVVMSEGRIEQVGAPAEIYNVPATPFVASFVGTLNVLECRVVDAPEARLRFGDVEIRVARGLADAQAGDAVSVALRPEAVSLGPGNDGANVLRGTVDDVSFLGSVVRLRVKTSGGTISVDLFNEPNLRLPLVGEVVAVSFPPEACVVLGRAEAGGVDELAALEAE